MEPDRRKSGGCGCMIIAAVILVLGCGTGIGMYVYTSFQAKEMMESTHEIDLPGESKEIALKARGTYTVYNIALEGPEKKPVLPEGFRLTIKHKDSGTEVSLIDAPEATLPQPMKTGQYGFPIYEFEVTGPGDYIVDGQAASEVQLVIGQYDIWSVIFFSCTSMSLIAASLIAAIISGIFGIIKFVKKD